VPTRGFVWVERNKVIARNSVVTLWGFEWGFEKIAMKSWTTILSTFSGVMQ